MHPNYFSTTFFLFPVSFSISSVSLFLTLNLLYSSPYLFHYYYTFFTELILFLLRLLFPRCFYIISLSFNISPIPLSLYMYNCIVLRSFCHLCIQYVQLYSTQVILSSLYLYNCTAFRSFCHLCICTTVHVSEHMGWVRNVDLMSVFFGPGKPQGVGILGRGPDGRVREIQGSVYEQPKGEVDGSCHSKEGSK